MFAGRHLIFITVILGFHKLKIHSLNARGLRDFTTRKEFFQFVKATDVDIMLVQETHCTDRTQKLWINQWGGKIFFLMVFTMREEL